MLVLIAYDVNTEDNEGKTRLRHLSKQCLNYGQRVQNSVFECIVNYGESKLLKETLLKIIDPEKDSLRIYYLGNHYENKVEHFGVKEGIDQEGILIL